jgi:hypothetical protein
MEPPGNPRQRLRHGADPQQRQDSALRRTTSPAAGPGQHRHTEWHHQWMARMHKVNQWHPSLGQHRVCFRGPYIKVPAGKPLLNGDVVKGLVRLDPGRQRKAPVCQGGHLAGLSTRQAQSDRPGCQALLTG